MSQKIGLYHLKTVDGSHLTMSNIKMGLNLQSLAPLFGLRFLFGPFIEIRIKPALITTNSISGLGAKWAQSVRPTVI